MHLLTIVFGPSPTPWSLLFKSQEAADRAIMDTEKPGAFVTIIDDFGQRATISAHSIHGFMLEDMEQ